MIAPALSTAQTGSGGKADRRVRMGIVGGGFGAAFQWHLDPGCVVQAVSDLREDRRKVLRDVYRCDNIYPSLEELIRDQSVDAVAVFTGAPDHVRHACACMKAGKHVISAVPAAISMEQAEELWETQKVTGMTYMMAETSYYHQAMISARWFYKEGKFGDLYYTEAEYHHAGMEYALWQEADGTHTWRWAFPPMLYPTHCTAFLVGLTGERLVEVTCIGWKDGDPIMKGNPYKNEFWSETALFKTDRGHAFRVAVYWRGAFVGTERAQWYGSKMSFFEPHPNGTGAVIRRASGVMEKDSAGFTRAAAEFEPYTIPEWWQTELPEPMRMYVGHDGAEPFLTHEFVDALRHGREPAISLEEALAYTVPGIVAHKSACQGGRQMSIKNFGKQTG
ncbi:MAG: Gfo/Idh/MocA family oxidoreductase [Armatimonadetes bacterium]|nr:Gfo/Idh/MocA family oxidoreductase [Armatimonadota bacterium]